MLWSLSCIIPRHIETENNLHFFVFWCHFLFFLMPHVAGTPAKSKIDSLQIYSAELEQKGFWLFIWACKRLFYLANIVDSSQELKNCIAIYHLAKLSNYFANFPIFSGICAGESYVTYKTLLQCNWLLL